MPTLIISPYAKPGYIDHTQYQFESMLKFIEWRFSLQPLTERDLHANNLLNAFDFSQKPLPPHVVPVTRSGVKRNSSIHKSRKDYRLTLPAGRPKLWIGRTKFGFKPKKPSL